MIWNYFIHLGIENFTNQYGSKTKNQTIVDDKNKAGCCKCKSFIILLFIWIIVETIYWGLTQVFFLFFVCVCFCLCVCVFLIMIIIILFLFFWLLLIILLIILILLFIIIDYSYSFIYYYYYSYVFILLFIINLYFIIKILKIYYNFIISLFIKIPWK